MSKQALLDAAGPFHHVMELGIACIFTKKCAKGLEKVAVAKQLDYFEFHIAH
jgi:hypothetical protein